MGAAGTRAEAGHPYRGRMPGPVRLVVVLGLLVLTA